VADAHAESAADSSGLKSAAYKQKATKSSANFMFHYRGLGCLRDVFVAPGRCNLLQSVANALREANLLQTVHKLLQSVAKHENLRIQRPGVLAPFRIS
jgi:hypothetical protein